MLNCNYNKVKVLNDLVEISKFIDSYTKNDAEEAGHDGCYEAFNELKTEIEKQIQKLQQGIQELSKEDLFN